MDDEKPMDDRPGGDGPTDDGPTDKRAELNDRPASELDDERDREELRQRYYGLLQELRVLLPGVQILVAFLLVVPFNDGFAALDATGRDLYAVALTSGVLAVIALISPTVFHRIANRQSRSARLVWGIRCTRLGLVLLGISLLSAVAVVGRVVFDSWVATALTVGLGAAMVVMWLVVPLRFGHTKEEE